ncbi:secreted protein, putative, partial [Ixodes scapularis]
RQIVSLVIFNVFSTVSAERECRAPHPLSSCAPGTPITWMYYFDNHTDRCQKYLGCGGGRNDFGSKGCCIDSCPYGLFHAYSLTHI